MNPETSRGQRFPFLRRMRAFLRGDFHVAEGVEKPPSPAEVPWVMYAKTEPDLAEYALQAALRGFADADKARQAIQSKATGFLTTILALFALSTAATILPASAGQPVWSWAAFVFFVLADICFVSAAVAAFLASGLTLGGGLNISRLSEDEAPSLDALKAMEADAWYAATEVAYWSGQKKAADLFLARRMVVIALLLATLGAVFLPFG